MTGEDLQHGIPGAGAGLAHQERLRCEAGESHIALPGERMIGARDDDQRIRDQRLDHHAACRRRVGDQVKIVLVAPQPVHHGTAVVDVQAGPDSRMALRESAEQARCETARRRCHRDAQLAGSQAAHVVERIFQRTQRAKNVVAAVIDAASDIGRVHPLADLLEQR